MALFDHPASHSRAASALRSGIGVSESAFGQATWALSSDVVWRGAAESCSACSGAVGVRAGAGRSATVAEVSTASSGVCRSSLTSTSRRRSGLGGALTASAPGGSEAGVWWVERIRTTVRCVEASSTSGGTEAMTEASRPGTDASAATTACIALAVTETRAPATSNPHGYQAPGRPSRATTAMVATTMSPSTSSGHTHAWEPAIPERRARSARAVKDSQNAPRAMPIVPPAAVMTAHPHRCEPTMITSPGTPADAMGPFVPE